MAQAVINYAALGRRQKVGGGKVAPVALTLIAVAFLTFFVLIPAGNVFYQALSKGFRAYTSILNPPAIDEAKVEALKAKAADKATPFRERRELSKQVNALYAPHEQARKTWSSIRMTLFITTLAVPINALFGVAAAWAITKFRFKGRSFLVSLIDLPFSVSPVVSGLVFVLLMGRQGFFESWSSGTRFVWLSPAVRAVPHALLAMLLIAFLTFIAMGITRQLMVPGPDARRYVRKVRRVGIRAATFVPLIIVGVAYVWRPEWNWHWLAPSGWTFPDPTTMSWRGFSGGHLWPFNPPEWAHGIIFTPLATLLASLFVTFPFVARALIPLMESQGADAEQAAASLGASGFTTFWKVTLPSIKWGLIYGVILCTARSLGEFGAVSVVTAHLDTTDTMPLRVEKLWQSNDTQAAFTVASLLAMLAVVTLIIKTFSEWKAARDLKDVDAPPDVPGEVVAMKT